MALKPRFRYTLTECRWRKDTNLCWKDPDPRRAYNQKESKGKLFGSVFFHGKDNIRKLQEKYDQ